MFVFAVAFSCEMRRTCHREFFFTWPNNNNNNNNYYNNKKNDAQSNDDAKIPNNKPKIVCFVLSECGQKHSAVTTNWAVDNFIYQKTETPGSEFKMKI